MMRINYSLKCLKKHLLLLLLSTFLPSFGANENTVLYEKGYVISDTTELMYKIADFPYTFCWLMPHNAKINSEQELKTEFASHNLLTGIPLADQQAETETAIWDNHNYQIACTVLKNSHTPDQYTCQYGRKRQMTRLNQVKETQNYPYELQDPFISTNNIFLTIDQLPNLLTNYKQLIGSFLIKNFNDINLSEYIEKHEAISRLTMCKGLSKGIDNLNLTKVRIATKYLAIKNIVTKEFVKDYELANNILNDILAFGIDEPEQLRIVLTNKSPEKYRLIVLAKREDNHLKSCPPVPLSKAAFSELSSLVKTIPFDIGGGKFVSSDNSFRVLVGDNIFTDENGNAIIIDTQLKAACPASVVDCLLDQLQAYPHDE